MQADASWPKSFFPICGVYEQFWKFRQTILFDFSFLCVRVGIGHLFAVRFIQTRGVRGISGLNASPRGQCRKIQAFTTNFRSRIITWKTQRNILKNWRGRWNIHRQMAKIEVQHRQIFHFWRWIPHIWQPWTPDYSNLISINLAGLSPRKMKKIIFFLTKISRGRVNSNARK